MSFQPKATREVQANRTSSETSDNSGISNFGFALSPLPSSLQPSKALIRQILLAESSGAIGLRATHIRCERPDVQRSNPLCSHNAACAEKRVDAVQSRHHPQDLLCRMIRDRQETERCTARDDLSSLRLRLESGPEVCFRYCASASSACVCVWARARI